jgi:hypothetical protein
MLPVVMVSTPDIVGFAVGTTVVVRVTVTVVSVGVAIVGDVAMVVADVATVVADVATVVACVVTLSALTGSTTMRSIARNTATGMTDDPLSCNIDKILPAGFTGDFL